MDQQDYRNKQIQQSILKSPENKSISPNQPESRQEDVGIDTAAGSGGPTQAHPLNPTIIQHQRQTSRRTNGTHKSEHKANKSREILNMFDIYQERSSLMGSGLIAVNQLQGIAEDLNISEANQPARTPNKSAMN